MADTSVTEKRHLVIYPERRVVGDAWIIQQAKDYLAIEYTRANPHADEAAIEENSRIRSVWEAREILEDAGLMTFGGTNRSSADGHIDRAERDLGVQ